MRFMLMMKADKAYESGQPPNPALMAAMGPYVEKMAKSGVLIETGGLLPSAHGTRVRLADSTFTVTDGPFAEAKEIVAGFMILTADDYEGAVAVVKAMPGMQMPGACVEIREMASS